MDEYNSPFPSRKQLRLQEYDYCQCNAYFVTVSVHNRIPLFGTIQESPVGAALRGRPNHPDILVTKWLFELEKKFPKVRLDYYCVMPDHVHFILFFDAEAEYGLPKVMEWYKTMTTNEYIRSVKAGLFPPFEKHFWQRTYYEHIIRNDTDLREIREYIESTPLRWLYKKKGCE